ncbi:MAG: hypothetical protein KJ990_00535 [Proteobacteria bacterium]|nr:hypothetical protein [Pseudomonadota bacterium]MBU1648415.1 hypothetical protein [Pseudomonadota bacterium]MBU1986015.1 hypothetical protein [Pseudomonadota bacterium]
MKPRSNNGQSPEDHVFSDQPAQSSAGNDASRVGVEYDLKNNSGSKNDSSAGVLLDTIIKAGRVHLVIHEMVQGIFDGTKENLKKDLGAGDKTIMPLFLWRGEKTLPFP